jgi:hypothetical protein
MCIYWQLDESCYHLPQWLLDEISPQEIKKLEKFSCDTFREELREMGIDPEKALKWNPNLLE